MLPVNCRWNPVLPDDFRWNAVLPVDFSWNSVRVVFRWNPVLPVHFRWNPVLPIDFNFHACSLLDVNSIVIASSTGPGELGVLKKENLSWPPRL